LLKLKRKPNLPSAMPRIKPLRRNWVTANRVGLAGIGRHGRKAKIVERIAAVVRVVKGVQIVDRAAVRVDRAMKDATKAGQVVAAVGVPLKGSQKLSWKS
jgi:hypothetical protein